MAIEKTCVDCGRVRSFYPSEVEGPNARYKLTDGIYRCSKCWNVRRKTTGEGARPHRRVFVACVDCGRKKEYVVSAAKYLSSTPRCRACYLRHYAKTGVPGNPRVQREPRRSSRADGVSPKDRVPVQCPTCKRTRLIQWKSAKRSGECPSCSHSGDKNSWWRGGPVTLTCALCGREKKVSKSASREYGGRDGKVLCLECWLENRDGENNPAWKGGVSFEPYPTGFTEKLKNTIRSRDVHLCQNCGNTRGRRKHAIHHIDYDKSNLDPFNLISLCIHCHPKTNFRRDEWTAYFQDKQSARGLKPRMVIHE